MLRRMRLRSTAAVLEEVRHLNGLGYYGLNFFDDELNINKQFMELLDGLAEIQERSGRELRCRGFVKAELLTDEQVRRMKDVGFRQVLCGFESGSDRILKNIKKNATKADNEHVMELAAKHGMEVKALMSIGHAGESERTVKDTMNWLMNVRPADFDITIITPYPGSPYYDDAAKVGSFVSGDVWAYTAANGDRLYMEDVDYAETADYYKGAPGEYKSYVWTEKLTAEELVQMRDEAEGAVRGRLGIEFNRADKSRVFEASMGQAGQVWRVGGRSGDGIKD